MQLMEKQIPGDDGEGYHPDDEETQPFGRAFNPVVYDGIREWFRNLRTGNNRNHGEV